ncbi:hypothetical protein JCM8547_009033 [Rhodosporidiobolus lusitaniae]
MAQNRPDALADRCLAKYVALDNKYGQNPCEVARILVDVCDGYQEAYYALAPLDLVNGQRQYRSPNPLQATSCLCSMGVYNLVQGCAACQSLAKYDATLWTNWVANCTMSNINNGQTFPYSIPSYTSLPDWACANNAGGSLSVGQVYRHMTGYNGTDPEAGGAGGVSSSTSTTTTEAASSASESYSEAKAAQTVSKVNGDEGDGSSGGGGSTTKVVAVVVPLVLVGALLGAVFAYLRKKRKLRRQTRGHKLASSSDLPGSSSSPAAFAAFGARSFRSNPSTVDFMGGSMMKQKDSRVSLVVPSESVFTRSGAGGSRRSRCSFATNSVSTHDADNPFLRRTSSTVYTPSTGFDTISQSGTEFSSSYLDGDGRSYLDNADEEEEEEDDDRSEGEDDDDDPSPFSDIHRPPPSVLPTRSNIHASPRSSEYRRSVSTFGSIHLSESSAASTRYGGRDEDGRSLLSVSSRGAPPSSSGATYGGLHDDDEEEDDASLRSRR